MFDEPATRRRSACTSSGRVTERRTVMRTSVVHVGDIVHTDTPCAVVAHRTSPAPRPLRHRPSPSRTTGLGRRTEGCRLVTQRTSARPVVRNRAMSTRNTHPGVSEGSGAEARALPRSLRTQPEPAVTRCTVLGDVRKGPRVTPGALHCGTYIPPLTHAARRAPRTPAPASGRGPAGRPAH